MKSTCFANNPIIHREDDLWKRVHIRQSVVYACQAWVFLCESTGVSVILH